MSIIDNLNEEQQEALKAIDGAILVTAGAGTGKTRLLTHRIAYMIQDLHVDPYNILAITFTNKAANEMKTRVENLVDGGSRVWISTFHSMCVRILRRDIDKLGGVYDKNFTIFSDTDTDKLVKEILKELGIKEETKHFTFHISNMKNNNMSLPTYAKEIEWQKDAQTTIKVITMYENKKAECNALDFDDLLYKTYELLSKNQEVLEYYTNRFEYILVDEFQDTNKIQYELTKLLASKHKNLFVVGDEDQSIYSWRGADFTNIFNITKDYDNSKMFKLQQNYRCTKNILAAANRLIANNTQRFDKKLWSDKDDGDEIDYKKYYDEKEEADMVASKIYSLVKNYGYKYSDIAVLLRVSAITLPFEEKLLTYNIPHKIYGAFKFFERAEIKNVLAYLRIFCNPKDEVSLLRIINFPKRGIGDGAISELRQVAEKNNMTLLEAILNIESFNNANLVKKFQEFSCIYKELQQDYQTQSLDDFVYYLLEKFKILESYNTADEDENDKVLNIDQLKGNIHDFCRVNPGATLADYLENITLMSDTDNIGDSDAVIISTIHAVKGLEFKVVFVVGMEDGIFPLSRAKDNDKELEEERRLAYVAFTRAEEKLFISSCKTRYLYGKRSYMNESQFIFEAGLAKKPFFKFQNDYIFANNNSSSKEQAKQQATPKVETKSNSYVDTTITYARESKQPKPVYGGYQTKQSQFLGMNKYNNPFNRAPNAEEPKEEKPKVDVSKYQVGQIVEHHKFGKGKLVALTEGGKLGDIEFETVGKKTLMMEIANLTIIS